MSAAAVEALVVILSCDFMVAGALSESGIKHGSVVDAVVVVTEVCE